MASRVTLTTTISACAGGTTSLLLSYLLHKKQFDATEAANGVLSGLVAITAACAVVEPYIAIFIGCFSCIACSLSARLVTQMELFY